MSNGTQRNRRRPPAPSEVQGILPRSRFAYALVLSGLLHAALVPLSWQSLPLPFDFSQAEPSTQQLTIVELAPEDDAALDPVEPAQDPEIQELQSFHDSALERAAELEQTLTDALGAQTEAEEKRQQQFTALEAAQANLSEQVDALTVERSELSAELAGERHRTAELERRLQEALQKRETALSGMKGTYDRLVSALKGEIAQKEIALHQAKEKLVVTILDRVLFPSGQAMLTPEGEVVLKKVGRILAKVNNRQIVIEGHTDNVPIGPALREQFPTNWELSTARATEVIKFLMAETGLPGTSLSAVGRADTTPVASNDSEEGRKQNRRIEIILSPLEGQSSSLS